MAIISKGLKSAIVCVLVLGLILEQVHNVEAKSCCKTTTQRNCYNLCRLGSRPRQVCASTCGCKIVSGRTCPRNYHLKFNDLAESGEPDAIQYCNVGCVSSACDDSDTMTDDGMMKIDMESCSDECDRFCKGSARMASSVTAE